MLMLESSLEDCVLPVCTYTEDRRIRINKIRVSDLTDSCHLIVELGILAKVHHVKTFCLL